jgi:hypothetical protein
MARSLQANFVCSQSTTTTATHNVIEECKQSLNQLINAPKWSDKAYTPSNTHKASFELSPNGNDLLNESDRVTETLGRSPFIIKKNISRQKANILFSLFFCRVFSVCSDIE